MTENRRPGRLTVCRSRRRTIAANGSSSASGSGCRGRPNGRALGVPQRLAHLRAGHRRHGGDHAGVGVERRAGGQGEDEHETRGGNRKGAELIGKTIAERLKEKGITRVIFDRNGFLYHGRVRAVAEAARQAGLEF